MCSTWPTDFASKCKRVVQASFSAARAEIDQDHLRRALAVKNYHGVEQALDGPVSAMRRSLEQGLADVLADVFNATGNKSYSILRARLRSKDQMKAAATVKSGGFNDTDPNALTWVQQHAAESISSISETTRTDIRELIEAAFEEQFDVDELAAQISDVIGNADRAEMIARTETMRASNAGQQQAWDQAKDEGLLTGQEVQEWIVTPDDRLCPICDDLDGAQAAMGETFHSDEMGEIDGPPAHPRCRCTLGLVIP